MNNEMEFYGNHNYLNYIDKDKYDSYEDITLEDLGFDRASVEFELKGMVDDLTNPNTGEDYTDDDYKNLILRSVAEVEKELDIVIRPRLMHDRKDFYQNNVNDYMFTRTDARPILHVEKLKTYFNNQDIMNYDDKWIKVNNRVGQIQVQPSIFMQAQRSLVNPLLMMPGGDAQWGFNGFVDDSAPQMIGFSYVAGMIPRKKGDEGINRDYYVPDDLIAYVAKYAAIDVLERWGRVILSPGIASYGVSIDNISSQIGTTASAENSATAGEIRNLQEDMKHIKQGLLAYYGGTNIGIIA